MTLDDKTRALTLPADDQFKAELEAINRFQRIAHSQMIVGHDYGIIPGTSKPTLLKPGAEKIIKLLGLADTYDFIDRQEDWSKPFFRYLVRATLTHISSGVVVCQGFGECNSMDSKYRYRWLFGSEVPEGLDKTKLPLRTITTKNGRAKQYRVDNDDPFSLVNTMIKMAKKRAQVDAALSAGRLSDVFTQDIEDSGPAQAAEGNVIAEEKAQSESLIDLDWLRESLDKLEWANVGKFIKQRYNITAPTIRECVTQMNAVQAADFVTEVKRRLDQSPSPGTPSSPL